jgi:hypothetical protein
VAWGSGLPFYLRIS